MGFNIDTGLGNLCQILCHRTYRTYSSYLQVLCKSLHKSFGVGKWTLRFLICGFRSKLAGLLKLSGLGWNSTIEIYFGSEAVHKNRLKINSTIVRKIGNTGDRGVIVSIAMPYASFDLKANFSLEKECRYFLLKRVENDTQPFWTGISPRSTSNSGTALVHVRN